ncbi:PP2C family protein-serine/threonine phosphatase [Roseivivax sp. CAU 1761]
MTALQDRRPATTGPAARFTALVVDDSRAQRMLMTRLLERWGYRVRAAASGEEALALCAAALPDLLVSDWMMPGMDGPDLCRRLRALGGADYAYAILLTAKTDKAAVAEGLDAGADDFLSKPVDAGELRARVNAGMRILTMQRELARTSRDLSDANDRLRAAHEAIDRDLRQARRIQDALIPETTRRFGASRVSLLLRPCGHVGGDLVGMFPAGPNRVAFYGIDVSGHGITSAMMTARIAGYLSARHPEQNLAFGGPEWLCPPEEVARRLNDRLDADPGVDEYFTMAFADIDLGSGALRLVQAGHPRPLLIRADGSTAFLGAGGLPIGLVPEVAHERVTVPLQPGDRVLLYSDGFVEAPVGGGGMLEEEGLLRLVAACAPDLRGPDLLEALFWHLVAEAPEGETPGDDVSAALFEFRAYPEDSRA